MTEMSALGQHPLALGTPVPHRRHSQLVALDLFTGIGGLAAGFAAAGFSVTGVDNEEVAEKIFAITAAGRFVRADLSSTMVADKVDLITGGPPCRPWSAVNQQRRLQNHGDHHLLAKYFEHVMEIRPAAFLMENVPPVGSDPTFRRWLDLLHSDGYGSESHLVRYADYGGASARIRRFTVGFRNSYHGAREFFARLRACRSPAGTVREAIFWARDLGRDAVADHDWSELRTIAKYTERYKTGRFGWKRLQYDSPAPSFGSVAKTYILHPEAGIDHFPMRVLSVREVLSIMDFGRNVRFPDATPRAKRYQMTANAVSPLVAQVCATIIRELLTGDVAASKAV